jgi:hypothetical protein
VLRTSLCNVIYQRGAELRKRGAGAPASYGYNKRGGAGSRGCWCVVYSHVVLLIHTTYIIIHVITNY